MKYHQLLITLICATITLLAIIPTTNATAGIEIVYHDGSIRLYSEITQIAPFTISDNLNDTQQLPISNLGVASISTRQIHKSLTNHYYIATNNGIGKYTSEGTIIWENTMTSIDYDEQRIVVDTNEQHVLVLSSQNTFPSLTRVTQFNATTGNEISVTNSNNIFSNLRYCDIHATDNTSHFIAYANYGTLATYRIIIAEINTGGVIHTQTSSPNTCGNTRGFADSRYSQGFVSGQGGGWLVTDNNNVVQTLFNDANSRQTPTIAAEITPTHLYHMETDFLDAFMNKRTITDGTLIWSTTNFDALQIDITVNEDVVYALTSTGRVYAFNDNNGIQRTYATNDIPATPIYITGIYATTTTPAPDDECVYESDFFGWCIKTINAADGWIILGIIILLTSIPILAAGYISNTIPFAVVIATIIVMIEITIFTIIQYIGLTTIIIMLVIASIIATIMIRTIWFGAKT